MFLWDYIPLSMNPSITLLHLVKTVWYSETSPEDFQTDFSFRNTAVTTSKPEFFPTTLLSSEVIVSLPMFSHAGFLLLSRFSKSLSLLPSSLSHRCTGVSCCGCSRYRLAGRLWSSALWRRAGNRCYKSRSPVCRQSNQRRAHLRSLARWAHHMTQLQAGKGQLTQHVMCSLNHMHERSAEQHLINTGIAGWHVIHGKVRFLNRNACTSLHHYNSDLIHSRHFWHIAAGKSTGGLNCTNGYCIQFRKITGIVHVSWNGFLKEFMEMMSSTCALLARSPREEF